MTRPARARNLPAVTLAPPPDPALFRRRLLALLRPQLPELFLAGLVLAVLSVAVPVFSLQTYDRVIGHGGLATLAGLTIGVVAAIVFDFLMRQARGRLAQRAGIAIDVATARLIGDRLTGLPLAEAERLGPGEWLGWQRDADALRDSLGAGLLLAVDLVFVILFVLVIALVAAPLLPVILVMIPLYAGLAFVSAGRIGAAQQTEQTGLRDRDARMAELIAGRATVIGQGLAPGLRPGFEAAQADGVRQSIARARAQDLANHLAGSLSLLTTVAMTVVGALAILDQAMTIGGLIAANMLAARIIQPFAQAVSSWRLIARARIAIARLAALDALPPERVFAAVAPVRGTGALTAEQLVYAYGPARAVDGVSAGFRPGGLHGITGANGSGKSTLLKLLGGLYPPQSGRVLLDGADLAQFGTADRARLIGHVPQDAGLIAGTVRATIARHADGVDDAAIRRAAALSGADAMIAAWPEGYDRPVGEQGRLLSAGQRQRLALARALLPDPPLLLLDEPSAHLDRAGEQALIATLQALAKTRTVILVSHSTALLAACDDLVVLDKGRIQIGGPAQTVLARLLSGKDAP